MMSGWIVTYAKITIDKDDGISLLGVYFGGVAGDSDEADNIAKECATTIPFTDRSVSLFSAPSKSKKKKKLVDYIVVHIIMTHTRVLVIL